MEMLPGSGLLFSLEELPLCNVEGVELRNSRNISWADAAEPRVEARLPPDVGFLFDLLVVV